MRDEALQSRLEKALASTQPPTGIEEDKLGAGDMMEDAMVPQMGKGKGKGNGNGKNMPAPEMAAAGQVAHVVGIIIGSPEFQRK